MRDLSDVKVGDKMVTAYHGIGRVRLQFATVTRVHKRYFETVGGHHDEWNLKGLCRGFDPYSHSIRREQPGDREAMAALDLRIKTEGFLDKILRQSNRLTDAQIEQLAALAREWGML